MLNYAEAMTLPDIGANDSHIEALHRQFSDEAIIELTALIAFQNLSSKFNAALDVPPQGFCELPIALDKPRAEALPDEGVISFSRNGTGEEP